MAAIASERAWRWGLWSPQDRSWADAVRDAWKAAENVDKSTQPTIPLTIHQIWLGGGEPPPECKDCMETWKALHPEWEYRLWSDDDAEGEIEASCPSLLQPYQQAGNPAEKSDLLRLALVLRHGGLYVDVDFECLKQLDSLHYKYSFYSGESNVGAFEINNGLFAACPEHPVVRFFCEHVTRPWAAWGGSDVDPQEAVAYQLARSGALGGFGMTEFSQGEGEASFLATTGPGFFTRAVAVSLLRSVGKSDSGFSHSTAPAVICPCDYFYPLPNTARKLPKQERLAYATVDSYALHHWCRTWLPEAEPQE